MASGPTQCTMRWGLSTSLGSGAWSWAQRRPGELVHGVDHAAVAVDNMCTEGVQDAWLQTGGMGARMSLVACLQLQGGSGHPTCRFVAACHAVERPNSSSAIAYLCEVSMHLHFLPTSTFTMRKLHFLLVQAPRM